MFHRGWRSVDAKLVERGRVISGGMHGDVAGLGIKLHELTVEFAHEGGQVVRLPVKQVDGVVIPDIGGTLPILVKPDGTEAVIDKQDPRINIRKGGTADWRVLGPSSSPAPGSRKDAPPPSDPQLAELAELEQAEAGSGTRAAGGPAARSESRLDRLEQLAGLHTRGVLTDAEFEAEKARILSDD